MAVLVLEVADGDVTLRTGLVPLGFATLCFSCALVFVQAAWSGLGSPPRVAVPAAVLAAGSLVFTGLFFLALAVLYAMGSQLLDDVDALPAVVGTFLASAASFLLLPAAVLVHSGTMLRDPRVSAAAGAAPLAAVVLLLAGAAATAALPDRYAWPTLVAAVFLAWCAVTFTAFSLAGRTDPE